MSDLISRQAAIKIADEECFELKGIFGRIEDGLNALPSVQPEIIRCKDCAKRVNCRTSNVWAVAPGDDWYCADAERREG